MPVLVIIRSPILISMVLSNERYSMQIFIAVAVLMLMLERRIFYITFFTTPCITFQFNHTLQNIYAVISLQCLVAIYFLMNKIMCILNSMMKPLFICCCIKVSNCKMNSIIYLNQTMYC